jgi:hypothetical protein
MMAPNTNAATPPRESLFADDDAARLLFVGPATPVCAPVPDPVAVALLPEPAPLAAAVPEGLDALPEADFVAADADAAEADAEPEADAVVALATEEPETLTAAELPLIEPAVPDISL